MSSPGADGRAGRFGGLWAMAASGTGVALGLLREFLIVRQLGWSGVNDRLQIYLSVIYGVSLANEAVRLGAINLLQSRSMAKAAISILPLGALFSLAASLWMAFTLRPDSILLVIGAGFSGWLNMLMILMVTAKQRGGAFWPAHLINLLPNALLIPGIIAVGVVKPADPVPALAMLYYSLPVVQILLLTLVKTEPVPAAESVPTNGSAVFLAHSSSALGNLVFQGVLRQIGLGASDGVLALLAISIRVYDSIRFVVIDTVIGRQLAAWKQKNDLQQAVVWTSKLVVPQAIVAVVGLAVAFTVQGTAGALIVLAISIGSFGLRLIYFLVNSQAVSLRLAWTYGLQDVLAAVAMYGLAMTPFRWPALLVWVWYVAKPLFQLLTVKKFVAASEAAA